MEEVNESMESSIFSLWLNSYSENDTDEYKIFDLSKRFNVPTKTVIEVVN